MLFANSCIKQSNMKLLLLLLAFCLFFCNSKYWSKNLLQSACACNQYVIIQFNYFKVKCSIRILSLVKISVYQTASTCQSHCAEVMWNRLLYLQLMKFGVDSAEGRSVRDWSVGETLCLKLLPQFLSHQSNFNWSEVP